MWPRRPCRLPGPSEHPMAAVGRKHVSDLLEFVTEVHGGRELWSHASTVTASVDFHGGFFEARGQSDLLGPCEVTAALDRQYISVSSAKSGHTIFFDGKQDR